MSAAFRFSSARSLDECATYEQASPMKVSDIVVIACEQVVSGAS
jgi:hypothetical protein